MAGFEPGIFCSVGGRDGHYATPPELPSNAFTFLKNDNNGLRWWVPISYTTLGRGFDSTKNSFWMSPDEESKTVILDKPLDNEEPLFVNVQQTGFYRFVRMYAKIGHNSSFKFMF
jgi:hypothetical protein